MVKGSRLRGASGGRVSWLRVGRGEEEEKEDDIKVMVKFGEVECVNGVRSITLEVVVIRLQKNS